MAEIPKELQAYLMVVGVVADLRDLYTKRFSGKKHPKYSKILKIINGIYLQIDSAADYVTDIYTQESEQYTTYEKILLSANEAANYLCVVVTGLQEKSMGGDYEYIDHEKNMQAFYDNYNQLMDLTNDLLGRVDRAEFHIK